MGNDGQVWEGGSALPACEGCEVKWGFHVGGAVLHRRASPELLYIQLLCPQHRKDVELLEPEEVMEML